MGYGIFRRAPYVGKPRRKCLAVALFPPSSLDKPPLKHPPVPRATYRRAKPKIAKRKQFSLSAISADPPLHKPKLLWSVFRRRPPKIFRKRPLNAALFTVTALNSPPLRKPRLSYRLFRKPPFRRLARKVLNLALFLKAPVVGKRVFDWSAPRGWRAQTNRAKRVAGVFFAVPPVVVPTTVPGPADKKKKRGLVGGKWVLFDTPEELSRLRKEYRDNKKPKVEEAPAEAAPAETAAPVEAPAPAPAIEPKYIADFAQYLTPPPLPPPAPPNPPEPPLPKMKDVDPDDEDGSLWMLLDE